MVLESGRLGLSRVFCVVGGSEAERDPYSESEGEEEQVGVEDEEEMMASVAPERWDVLGLGQAMVMASPTLSFLWFSMCINLLHIFWS